MASPTDVVIQLAAEALATRERRIAELADEVDVLRSRVEALTADDEHLQAEQNGAPRSSETTMAANAGDLA